MDSLKPLFLYLDKEDISIDTQEFEFQFNSHPDYPSLLALSDTLKFFNIENGAFNIEKSEIDLLPNSFIARLKNNHSDYLSFVEKKENTFVYTNGTEQKHSASKDNFKTLWDNVVLLAEKHSEDVSKPKTKNWLSLLIPSLSVLLFISVISINLPSKWFLTFYFFPLIGVFLSVAALKDLFNTKSELLDKFCKATIDSSCKTVVNSSKWKIFDTISFSDLSILFFTTQICALFLMGISENLLSYFYIQTFLLFLSVPVIVISIYYQKNIEQKWCPICLTIMGVMLLELGYVLYLNSFLDLSVSLYGVLLFLLVTSIITTGWFPLKKILTKVNHLKDEELKANRFKRNYNTFKLLLTSEERYNLPETKLVFGNKNANLQISIITSPFCGHCEEPYKMLKDIERLYGKQLQISIFYNISNNDSWLVRFVSILVEKRLKCQNDYYTAMDHWYDIKDDDTWLKHCEINDDTRTFDYSEELFSHSKFFLKNNLNFTPCLFINGYMYPKGYKIKELPFLVDELIEDFNKKENKVL